VSPLATPNSNTTATPQPDTTNNEQNGTQGAPERKNELWLLEPRKLLWVFSQLRADGLLSNKMVAVIVVHLLPDIISKVSGDLEMINSKASEDAPRLKNALGALMGILLSRPNFDACVDSMSQLVERGVPEAGEVLLLFLHTVQSLQFSEQIEVISACAESLTMLLHSKLDRVDQHTPTAYKTSIVHDSVVCTGCGMSPLRGPRFICRSRAHFDLCGDCFANKTLHHANDFASHDFDMQVLDVATVEKYHNMNKASHFINKLAGWGQSLSNLPPRACANGCGRAATWHPTHCCIKCMSGGGGHGPMCERSPASK